jgi:hypothetical protein
MSDYGKGVKKLPFYGIKEILYLWTTQLVGYADTYICPQVIFGSIMFPKEIQL